MSDKIIPLYGSISDAATLYGFGRSFIIELIRGCVLRTVDIEGRRFVALREGAQRLQQAEITGERIIIAGEHRAQELARKSRLREAKRAQRRAAAALERKNRRTSDAPPPSSTE
jgi:hypothetical protein